MQEEAMPADCAVRVSAGEDLAQVLAAAADGAVVCLAAGRYAANLVIARSVTLRGIGGAEAVVLDGGARAAVLAVHADDLRVRVEGVSLVGGSAAQGGALEVSGMSEVVLARCVLRDNRGRQGPGGAVSADQGTVVLERCRVFDNTATDGLAVNADQIATVRIRDSLLVGAGDGGRAVVRAHDGALVEVARSTIVAAGGGVALHASGTSSRAAEVEVSDSVLSGEPALATPEPFAGKVAIARSVLSSAGGAYVDGGGVAVADPGFGGSEGEPYRPRAGSAACGIAEGGGVDLAGRARPAQGGCAGAFQAP